MIQGVFETRTKGRVREREREEEFEMARDEIRISLIETAFRSRGEKPFLQGALLTDIIRSTTTWREESPDNRGGEAIIERKARILSALATRRAESIPDRN